MGPRFRLGLVSVRFRPSSSSGEASDVVLGLGVGLSLD